MVQKTNATTKQQHPDFVISKTFAATPQTIWDAFTKPSEMALWWGPKGAKILKQVLDFRVGGSYLYGMHFAGQDMWGKMVYLEINKPQKIVFENMFSDKDGGIQQHPLSATWPIKLLTIFELSSKDNATTVKITWRPINPTVIEQKTFDDGHASMTQGWSGTFEQLGAYLESKTKNKTM